MGEDSIYFLPVGGLLDDNSAALPFSGRKDANSKSCTIKVLMCGLNPEGEITPIAVDADGKIIISDE